MAHGEGNPNRLQRELRLGQLLTALDRRVARMVDEQDVINKGMEALIQVIEQRADRKPREEDRPAARRLADGMAALSRETSALVRMLEAEGSAVAFPEVFVQVRMDMDRVERRLRQLDLGPTTREIAADILDTLREMISALRKSR